MKLSNNFTLEEFTRSNTASVLSIDNSPDSKQLENIKRLVNNVLQPLRNKFGKSIRISSGFRCSEVNKRIGGASTSQHTKGEAADIKSSDNAEMFDIIRNDLDFDQLIWEKGNDLQPAWIHVSLKKSGNRKQVLRYDGKSYKPF